MKTLKNPFVMFGRIFLSLGVAFLAGFIISIFVNHFQLSRPIILVFGINGAVWLILGICFYLPAMISTRKYERLRKEGNRYDAQIVQLLPNYLMRISGSSPVNAECTYSNQDNKTCIVKSDLFLWSAPKEDLNAVVYVNSKNPRDYFVEINSKAEVNNKYDYDYR